MREASGRHWGLWGDGVGEVQDEERDWAWCNSLKVGGEVLALVLIYLFIFLCLFQAALEVCRTFYRKIKGEGVVMVADPPFGGLVEPLAVTFKVNCYVERRSQPRFSIVIIYCKVNCICIYFLSRILADLSESEHWKNIHALCSLLKNRLIWCWLYPWYTLFFILIMYLKNGS